MANRRFNQFHFSLQPKLRSIFGEFKIGSASAVSSFKGNGVASVTKLASGIWAIMLQDNYNYFLNSNLSVRAPAQGSAVSGGSFVTGQLYQIVTLGTTTTAQWVAAGVPAGIAPAVGVPFVALGAGAGNGTVKAILDANIDQLLLAENCQLQLKNTNAQILSGGSGSIFILQALMNQMTSQSGATHTNTTVDGLTSTQNMRVGQLISGTGIPLGTTIASITSATAITISQAATASATVNVVSGPGFSPADPTPNSIISFELMFRDTALLA